MQNEMTEVIVRRLLLDWNHWMSVQAMNFYSYHTPTHKSTFGVYYITRSPGQLGHRVAGFPGHWVAGSQNVTQFHVWPLPGMRCGLKHMATRALRARPNPQCSVRDEAGWLYPVRRAGRWLIQQLLWLLRVSRKWGHRGWQTRGYCSFHVTENLLRWTLAPPETTYHPGNRHHIHLSPC